jgi:hypothetical protein
MSSREEAAFAMRRVVVSAKVRPTLRDRLQQMALDAGEPRLGVYLRQLLEHHAQGRVLCHECGYAHPVHQRNN